MPKTLYLNIPKVSSPSHPLVVTLLPPPTLVSLACTLPLLVAASRTGDDWGEVPVGRVAGLGVAVAVLHIVRSLAVGNAHVRAGPHHTVTCREEIMSFDQ